MKNKKLGSGGEFWELSKLAVLIAGVMIFTIMWGFYNEYCRMEAVTWASHTSRDIARVLDEVASSPNYLKVEYDLPEKGIVQDYEINICPSWVLVHLRGEYSGIQRSAAVRSRIDSNVSYSPGSVIIIERNIRNSSIILS